MELTGFPCTLTVPEFDFRDRVGVLSSAGEKRCIAHRVLRSLLWKECS